MTNRNMAIEAPTRGLIIRSSWIEMILDSRKDWEMRSTPTRQRGPIALIRKGSGTIVGIADLADVLPALSPEEMLVHTERHCIPQAMIESARWFNGRFPGFWPM